MTRAAPMPPEQRRAAIVDAALDLMEANGPELTTRMVAEAAGVAEGTIFRVFPTLPDLLGATYSEFLSRERLMVSLEAVELGDTLESKTLGCVRGIVDYFSHIHSVLPPPKHESAPSPNAACVRDAHKERFADLRDWVVATISPHTDELTISPENYSHFLKALAMGMAMARPGGLTPEDITRFALDGARRKDLP
ncbi:TetR/AcrR family transcriptional regulator [Tessaracoccus antarcticus]|uniref:TetR/AcrR family transcriptional regulator n=1 Tax=Tessaracoccus antarcticus TaxID=2479848 RepID=A0A3M0GJ96_9ACTN|nr:TetR/AcrR family transcriptional regulator [Tessaracoccus antarcticus]RMB61693.1 TetR/AcrR family transcriptional regulator [Tessaracoccus antarcticus]